MHTIRFSGKVNRLEIFLVLKQFLSFDEAARLAQSTAGSFNIEQAESVAAQLESIGLTVEVTEQ